MRIAYISYEFPPDTGKGGIGTYTSQIAGAMASLKNDVHVFVGSPNSQASEKENGYTVHRIKSINGNDFREKVVKVFALQNEMATFDLMESPEINCNAWEVKKGFPEIPLVVRLHAPNHLVESLKKYYLPATAKWRFFLGALKRFRFDLGYWRPYKKEADPDYQFTLLADAITAPSNAMKEWVMKNWQLNDSRITVIPNIFSPPSAFLNIPLAENNEYKRIVFFGRLNVLKGLVNATKAMKKILVQNPQWQFRVIGDDGPGLNNNINMRAWMQQELKEVESRVEFINGLDYAALPAAITDCEIVLLPSLFESFSYTAAEAMSAGKAVIGSKNAGMADLIDNDKSGLLVDPFSVSDITKALQNLIDDMSLRFQLAVNARHAVLQKAKASYSFFQFNSYYQSVIQS